MADSDTAMTAKKSPRPGGPCGGGSSSPIPASTAAALPMAGGGAPDGHSAPTHKVVENSKKKKKFVDLKSMWGRAEKKQKSVVQSNSPEPVQEVGCNKGQELAIVETEPQFGNGSTEASKPQVASTQSEDEDWWEDYDDDVDYLPHDPGKRIAITDYDANLQDEVRRRYIALGIMHLPFQLTLFVSDMRRDERFREVKSIAALSVMLVDTKKHLSYPLVYKLLKLVLVLPVATASVERVFSAMNFVKNKLRNRMGDEYLNDCLVTFLEREFFLQVRDEDIISRFQADPRRVEL